MTLLQQLSLPTVTQTWNHRLWGGGAGASISQLEAGASSFAVLEVNKFKHLSHLTLRCRPGTDAAIKQYLAARVWDLKAERAELTHSLADATDAGAAAAAAAAAAEAEAASLRDASSAAAGAAANAAEARLNTARQEALAAAQEAAAAHGKELAEAEARHQQLLDAAMKRAAELDSQVCG
jgi:spindle assembly abnormal protein 6